MRRHCTIPQIDGAKEVLVAFQGEVQMCSVDFFVVVSL